MKKSFQIYRIELPVNRGWKTPSFKALTLVLLVEVASKRARELKIVKYNPEPNPTSCLAQFARKSPMMYLPTRMVVFGVENAISGGIQAA